MRFTTPHGSVRYRLPWSWSAFDYRALCELLDDQNDARFHPARCDSIRRDRPLRVCLRRGDGVGGGDVSGVGVRSPPRDPTVAHQQCLRPGPGAVDPTVARTVRSILDALLSRARAAVRVEQDAARMRPNDVPVLVGDASPW